MGKDDNATYFEPLPLETTRLQETSRPKTQPNGGRNYAGTNGLATYARRLHLVKSLYPWMKADQAVALAKSPHGVRSEAAMNIAFAAAKSKQKRGFNWLSPGDYVDKGAAALRMSGTVAQAAGEAVGSEIPEGLRNATKTGVRGAFTAFQGVTDAVSSGVRGEARRQAELRKMGYNPGAPPLDQNLRRRQAAEAEAQLEGRSESGINFGRPDPLGSNTLVQAVRKLVNGEEVDLGEGFFPEGSLREEVTEAQRGEAWVNDPTAEGGRSALTFGRGIAVQVTEPGTTPYKILSGAIDLAAQMGDPLARATKLSSEARTASRTFGATKILTGAEQADEPARFVAGAKSIDDTVDELTAMRRAAGLIPDGTRRTVQQARASEWLSSRSGQKVVDFLAQNKSARDIWEKLPGLEPSDALAIARTKTPEQARAVFEPLLGVAVREKPGAGFTSALPNRIRRTARNVRLFADMPNPRGVDANDANAVAKQLLSEMTNAKVDPARIERRFADLAEARSPFARKQVMFRAFKDINDSLLGRGIDFDVAHAATRLFTDANEGISKYNIDQLGNNVGHLGAIVDGRGIPSAHPQLVGEYLDNIIPSVDARTIRRLASPYRTLLSKTTADGETLPRIPLVVADYAMNKIWKSVAVLRPALAVRIIGESQARMGAVGLDSIVSHPIDAIGWIVGRVGKGDALGNDFDALDDLSAYARSMSRRRATLDETVLRSGWDTVPITTKAGPTGLGSELAQLAGDPVARRVAGGFPEGDEAWRTGNNVVDTQRWFWDGGGKPLRLQLAADAAKNELAESRDAANRYVQEVFERVVTKTTNNSELLEVVRTGKYNGKAIAGSVIKGETDSNGLNKAFVDRLRELIDTGVGPAMVKAPKLTREGMHGNLLDHADSALTFMFQYLLGVPLDTMNYSPAFKQLYWQRMAEVAAYGTPEAKATVLKNAQKYKLPENIVGAIRNAKPGAAHYSAEDLHLIAAGYASEESLKLLDNMTTRGQFADIARNFFPFGEAWKDALTAWSRIGTRQPEVFRRFQQTIEGAESSGFFAPDPETGEEMFIFPFSPQITRAVLGVPIPLTGRVGGLNVFSDNPLMPGFGPTVQMAAEKILRDKPEFDDLRKFISPYGTEELGGFFSPGFAEKAMKAMRADGSDRQFASTVADMASYLYSTGEYDMSSKTGMRELERDAREGARRLFMLRAFGQALGPTAPSPRMVAQDKNGEIVLKSVLAKKLAEFRDEDEKARRAGREPEQNANERFLAYFGPNALLFLQPKTQREGKGVDTEDGYAWVRRNKKAVNAYPDAYGYFAPQEGEFSFEAFDRLIENGEVRTLTPAEFLEAANARAARMIYNNIRDQLGERADSKAGRTNLRRLKARLVEDFPGYNPEYLNDGRRFKQLEQLKAAVKDPALAKNQTVRAIAAYMSVRDEALRRLDAQGLASLDSNAARPYARRLREVARRIIDDTPAFADVFYELFNYELGEN